MINVNEILNVIQNEKGSAVIESAICLSVVLMLFLGYMFFIEAYRTSVVMEHAAMEGARYAAAERSADAGIKKAEEILKAGVVTTIAGPYPEVEASGQNITIEVDTKVRVPFLNKDNLVIRRSAELIEEIDFFIYDHYSHLPPEERKGYTGNPYSVD